MFALTCEHSRFLTLVLSPGLAYVPLVCSL